MKRKCLRIDRLKLDFNKNGSSGAVFICDSFVVTVLFISKTPVSPLSLSCLLFSLLR
jgi:hypothetical protein